MAISWCDEARRAITGSDPPRTARSRVNYFMKKIFVPLAMMRFPVGVTLPTHIVRETYLVRLLACDLEPVLISPIFPQPLIDARYAECDGVLLMGGGDIDPSHFRTVAHPTTKIDDPRRDELELALARRAIVDRKPMLGVCRGAQTIAVAQGGTLHQHLPESVPDERHGVSEGGNYDDLLKRAQRHDVLLEPQSHIRKILGKDRVSVPSGHHQAVDVPGNDLIISGRSPKGVAEVIEHIDPSYFCFGIQSHPEMPNADDLKPLFEAFAHAARAYRP